MYTDKGIITSRKNSTVLSVCALSEKKEREKTGLFRFDGIKLAHEAFANGIIPELILLKNSKSKAVENRLGAFPACEIITLDDGVFDKVSDEKSPEGIICVAKHLDNFRKIATINKSDDVFPDNERIILLESVRDPGNLGTVIRSAVALGIGRIVVSDDCADIYNPKTMRAAMGSLFRVKVDVCLSLPEAVNNLTSHGRRVFSAALDGNALRLGDFDVLNSDCFVVGNEGHGLTDGTVNACTSSVYIPMAEGSESLNAAAAAAILLWEQRRGIND